mgnify:CR=1 FL=1|tara:strand:- start:11837 stop:12142 length:306 start_codon:yes stop_codon:yes gene_type:complete
MTIDELIQNFYLQQKQVNVEIEKYDTEFADKKLNPYGVTTIEFEKRSEAIRKRSQLEGAIDALLICKRDVLNDDSEVSIPNNLEIEGGGNEEMEIIGGSSS